ncbi:MAG: four helix bundle protein [Betaproteobacteria bacterium]|nr:four helix bundle protein [Betaproteobacteria bacterium]
MKYSELKVWQKSLELVDELYEVSSGFPPSERFGISSQLQRAAVSVPSNIAEGHGRKSTQAFLNHLSIAFGSLMEVETLILIAERRKYVDRNKSASLLAQTDQIGKMLSGLRKSLNKR